MKVSTEWLSEYVRLPELVDELSRRLTMAGLEVEGVEDPSRQLRGVVVAQIVEAKPHPNADKLAVTQVDAGGAARLQVVCGAKNYKVGDKVPLATVGTKLPGGLEIKEAALRGVPSFGMLCSAKELGLADEASGLLILDAAATPGTPIAAALGLRGAVLELNVTPNRADALSHVGIAREVAALTGQKLTLPPATMAESDESASSRVRIRIEDPAGCSRYAARVVEGVTVGPSPHWLQDRLRACGVRPLSNVVDVTNYVLLEYGHPLHAFDLDHVAGQEIVVRRARPGEELTTLDDKERSLQGDDLVICDRDRPQVLAGVMGGATSAVTAGTRRVLLEAAHFDPPTIRRATKRHALHSESSHRFERGTDVEVIGAVLDRAASLIAQLAGGKILKGRVDVFPQAPTPRVVWLNQARVGRLLGREVSPEEISSILRALGFGLDAGGASLLQVQVPSFRLDVEREEDLIEEVARVLGYDSIPSVLPKGASTLAPESPRFEVERRLRLALSGQGYDEVINYSFVSPEELARIGTSTAAVALLNPLSSEHSVMRTSLWPSLLKNLSLGVRHGASSVRIYEIARTYHQDPSGALDTRHPANEQHEVAALLWGRRQGRTWAMKDEPVDLFDAKGAVEAMLASLNVDGAVCRPVQRPELHPKIAAEVLVGNRLIGHVGALHPRAAKAFELPGEVYLLSLNLDALVDVARLVPRYQPIAKFPAVLRDLAVVVPATLAHEAVERVILEVGQPLVRRVTLFDVYTGKPIPEGQKNLAYALEYRTADRTLTDEQVNEAHGRIVAQVTERLGGSLRA